MTQSYLKDLMDWIEADPWDCLRCRDAVGILTDTCPECGVHRDRPVVRHRRRRKKIGGRRGRNSGKVGSHG